MIRSSRPSTTYANARPRRPHHQVKEVIFEAPGLAHSWLTDPISPVNVGDRATKTEEALLEEAVRLHPVAADVESVHLDDPGIVQRLESEH